MANQQNQVRPRFWLGSVAPPAISPAPLVFQSRPTFRPITQIQEQLPPPNPVAPLAPAWSANQLPPTLTSSARNESMPTSPKTIIKHVAQSPESVEKGPKIWLNAKEVWDDKKVGKNVITIAGENEGAFMKVDGEKATDSSAKRAFMNSNVQGINNSIVYSTRFTHHDPGIRLALSTNRGQE